MNINIPYEVGDAVFYMDHDVIRKGSIVKIEITKESKNWTWIYFSVLRKSAISKFKFFVGYNLNACALVKKVGYTVDELLTNLKNG